AGQYLAEDALRRLRGLARLTVRDADWDEAILDRIATEHETIIEALADADPEAAATAMATHLTSSTPY
ncbi:MAG: FCD domain-containing protein, partial [Streptosporangiales bacterium]|nr:FCD domain-containing protein [Streptosporangiales bacterium]